MPKLIELTIELEIQKVSCPGVWLCQDGRVSLTVYALGTSYQTCLLPPTFPLLFKDIFYFRKRFQETCALNNICCLLKEETIYCELVQWSDDCTTGECVILAQYLGALNDVLFPPNMCSNDGVDLLMRRSKAFPGILSPKVEVSTKVRIDEVWNQSSVPHRTAACDCQKDDTARQRPVCHTAPYHRHKCFLDSPDTRPRSTSRSRSRSRSAASRSCISTTPKEPVHTCKCPSTPNPVSRRSPNCRANRLPSSGTRPAYNRNPNAGNSEYNTSPNVRCPEHNTSPNVRNPEYNTSPNVRCPEYNRCPNVSNPKYKTSPNVRYPEHNRRPNIRNSEYNISPDVRSPNIRKSVYNRSPDVRSRNIRSSDYNISPDVRSPDTRNSEYNRSPCPGYNTNSNISCPLYNRSRSRNRCRDSDRLSHTCPEYYLYNVKLNPTAWVNNARGSTDEDARLLFYRYVPSLNRYIDSSMQNLPRDTSGRLAAASFRVPASCNALVNPASMGTS